MLPRPAGLVVQVTGVFARRGYNVQSLAVGNSEREGMSRITIVRPWVGGGGQEGCIAMQAMQRMMGRFASTGGRPAATSSRPLPALNRPLLSSTGSGHPTGGPRQHQQHRQPHQAAQQAGVCGECGGADAGAARVAGAHARQGGLLGVAARGAGQPGIGERGGWHGAWGQWLVGENSRGV